MPMIPTLDRQPLLTHPTDILSYVLRWYTTSPKTISDTTPTAIISIIDTISRYQSNPSTLASKVASDLYSVYGNYFPVGTTTVDTSTSDNGNGTYNLTISISTIQGGSPYSIGVDITVGNSGILQFTPHPQL